MGLSELPQRTSPGIPPDLRDRVDQLVSAAGGALDEPMSLARLLCGVPSPRLSRTNLGKQPLSKRPLAGTLAHVPFRDVLEWVRAGMSDE